MKQIKIKIGDVAYPVKFGFGALRTMGGFWGLNGMDEVIQKVSSLVPQDGTEAAMMQFSVLEGLADVVLAGIYNASAETPEIATGDIVDAFMADADILKNVFELFMASMPKQKYDVDPSTRKTSGKQKAPQKARAKS